MKRNEEIKDNESTETEDLEYLVKAFKKWSPNILTSPYIPTPSLMIKPPKDDDGLISKKESVDNPLITKPSNLNSKRNRNKYEFIIDCLHKGAVAYSVGDYGTAINYFLRLLEMEWLKYSSYFYLVKTLIKLDIEKEIMSLQDKPKGNDVRLTKS